VKTSLWVDRTAGFCCLGRTTAPVANGDQEVTMSESKPLHPIRSLFWLTKQLFFLAALLITAVAIVGYWRGWITWQNNEQREQTTIYINTGEMEQATRQVITKLKDQLSQFGDKGPSPSEESGTQSPPAEQPAPERSASESHAGKPAASQDPIE
jgi:hypothetical protein